MILFVDGIYLDGRFLALHGGSLFKGLAKESSQLTILRATQLRSTNRLSHSFSALRQLYRGLED
jgi:hypothetical protein